MQILIIDDDVGLARSLARKLVELGHQVRTAESAAAGLLAARDSPPDLVLLDIQMPQITGLELLPQLKQLRPDLAVVMITGGASHQSAVQAMKLGAEDYLAKPFGAEEIGLILDRIATRHDLQRKLDQSRQRRIEDFSREHYFSAQPGMLKLQQALELVARRDQASVLVQGETGTGKEHAARLLHLYSDRSLGPFVELNCAALPDALIESELFGHEAGAFTGAQGRKAGLFETAQGGTIFLDEIGELSPHVQAKLLKVLEEKVCRRLGGLENIALDVRLVTASNRDLAKAVAKNLFRADLYYRLNAYPLNLPPLRERGEDLQALAAFFYRRACESFDQPRPPLTHACLQVLHEHDWPGNVRELKHFIERLVVSNETPSPESLRAALPLLRRARKQAEIDEPALREALHSAAGDKSKAARQLGVSRPTLYRYLKRFGLDV